MKEDQCVNYTWEETLLPISKRSEEITVVTSDDDWVFLPQTTCGIVCTVVVNFVTRVLGFGVRTWEERFRRVCPRLHITNVQRYFDWIFQRSLCP